MTLIRPIRRIRRIRKNKVLMPVVGALLLALGVSEPVWGQASAPRTAWLVSYAPGIMPIFMDRADGGTARAGFERRTPIRWLSAGMEAEVSRFYAVQMGNEDRQRNTSISAIARFDSEDHTGRLYILSGLALNWMNRETTDAGASPVRAQRFDVLVPLGVGFSVRLGRAQVFTELGFHMPLQVPLVFATASYPVGISPFAFGVKF